ncbi:ATP-NAD kinase-like domain-containing protein [Amanita rubescens]|nr:ATP-NAD kinase-like domain-containing protein [Amanita rubescens]
MGQNEISIRLSSGGIIAFNLTEDALTLSTSGTRRLSGSQVKLTVPHRQVLNACFRPADGTLHVAFVARHKDTKKFYLYRYYGSVNEASTNSASEWVEGLMHAAYEGAFFWLTYSWPNVSILRRGRNQPFSKVTHPCQPTRRYCTCPPHLIRNKADLIYTTHSGHAYEIAKELSVDDYDALVTVSGDGLVHEVMNGFANHPNPQKAFNIPIAPIPCGSGNGLSLNLLGERDGFDAVLATLNAIKGLPMRVDTFSLTQNNKRTMSFMSQALGLMADLDLGTEHLRWMGDTRFMVGLLYGILLLKPCPVRLSYKAAETDKFKMLEALQARRAQDQQPATTEARMEGGLPPLQYSTEDEDWTTLDEPLLYVYAGKGPYVGRDYMAFPVSLPDDGLIDIVAMPVISRSHMLRAFFWHPKLHYIKARAYRIEPLKNRGNLSVDGEAMPFEKFQVEVHTRLATLLSLHGSYVADFPSSGKKQRKWAGGSQR